MDSQFLGLKEDHAKVALKHHFGVSGAPCGPGGTILIDSGTITSGDGGWYESDIVCEIPQTNLDKIKHTLRTRKDSDLECKNLSILAYNLWVDDKELLSKKSRKMGILLSDSEWDKRVQRSRRK